jgi:hypothetical protein
VNSIPGIIIKREKEVAYDSPDYLMPWGTRRDNSRNRRFNEKLYKLFPQDNEFLKILDLGCSGGGFVRDCLNDGCLAVGLEGSDFSKKTRRAEWATIPDFLFTCDITEKFELFKEDKKGVEPILFNVITTWEVIEHISEQNLSKVAENVKQHLHKNGLWIMSVSPNEEIIGGVRLHQTVHLKPWWISKFQSLGFEHVEAYAQYFNTQYIRGPKYGGPGSFHLFLTKDPAFAPPIPKQNIAEILYDQWLGSRLQVILRRLLIGN